MPLPDRRDCALHYGIRRFREVGMEAEALELESVVPPDGDDRILRCCPCGGLIVVRGGDDEFGDHSWLECAECGATHDE